MCSKIPAFKNPTLSVRLLFDFTVMIGTSFALFLIFLMNVNASSLL